MRSLRSRNQQLYVTLRSPHHEILLTWLLHMISIMSTVGCPVSSRMHVLRQNSSIVTAQVPGPTEILSGACWHRRHHVINLIAPDWLRTISRVPQALANRYSIARPISLRAGYDFWHPFRLLARDSSLYYMGGVPLGFDGLL